VLRSCAVKQLSQVEFTCQSALLWCQTATQVDTPSLHRVPETRRKEEHNIGKGAWRRVDSESGNLNLNLNLSHPTNLSLAQHRVRDRSTAARCHRDIFPCGRTRPLLAVSISRRVSREKHHNQESISNSATSKMSQWLSESRCVIQYCGMKPRQNHGWIIRYDKASDESNL
jgi:hypothetical protein